MSGILNELARFISAPGADTLKALFSEKGFIPVPLGAIKLEDGTALTKQATTATGYLQVSNADTVIDIPVNGASKALGFSVPIPIDMDIAYPVEVKVLVGKSANNDELTLDCEVYPTATGDLANADAQGTAATAIVATGTVLTFTCTLSAMLSPPGGLSVVLTLGGTNDGDATYIYSTWLEYTKLLLNG